MATGVEELLDALFDMVDEAKNVPLRTDLCMLERDDVLDLIEDIKAQFPPELAEARKLVTQRAEYIGAAKREAETMLSRAEKEAKRLVEEETVFVSSRKQAAEKLSEAEESCRALKRSANEYCEDVLRRTEEAVTEACIEIKRSRDRFSASASGADMRDLPKGRLP
ncbi:MAG: hypothetical protein R3Y07_03475 [Eubacteriales bacterium]